MGESDELRLREDELTWREIAGEVVAADLGSSTYLNTNESGTLLWTALAQGTTRDGLVELLIAKYAIGRSQAETDVSAFLDSLRAQRLLVE
jgi:hypothetical protein